MASEFVEQGETRRGATAFVRAGRAACCHGDSWRFELTLGCSSRWTESSKCQRDTFTITTSYGIKAAKAGSRQTRSFEKTCAGADKGLVPRVADVLLHPTVVIIFS